MNKYGLLAIVGFAINAFAEIPATPVMSIYKFNGSLNVPYYSIRLFDQKGPFSPAGSLTQGTSLIPCLVIRDGYPLMDNEGTPYVGFDIVVNSDSATPDSVNQFNATVAKRKLLMVKNHHCPKSVQYVIDARRLVSRDTPPFFEPQQSGISPSSHSKDQDNADGIIRAFHNSAECRTANAQFVGRRDALNQAWDYFVQNNSRHWGQDSLVRARRLDYVMRTALFEGDLNRGCNAYGACERNIIALSIRNRAIGQCFKYRGCSVEGDFQGVSSKVAQYNIWDEYFTQTSALTSCFLRNDLVDISGKKGEFYTKLQAMYAQSLPDIERILFGTQEDLLKIFPQNALSDLFELRHYYHAPAMSKCFSNEYAVDYISAAIAKKGDDFALIANTLIHVDKKVTGGYRFRKFIVEALPERDKIEMLDSYPDFVIDHRKIDLNSSTRCAPYGIPTGCGFDKIGRYRKTPSWILEGKPLELRCKLKERSANCQSNPKMVSVSVGGQCDKEMRPFSGVR